MTIPYTFAGATTAIPLAQLDANFASPITLGNVAMTLSNTYTSIGNLTLTNVTINSGFLSTATIPTANGTVMLSGNMPAFSAYQSSAQTPSAATYTLLQLQTKEFDTGTCFNNTASPVTLNGLTVPAYAFMPNVAGYYQISGCCFMSALTTEVDIGIYKNASLFKRGLAIIGVTAVVISSNVSALIYLNGTTDYIQAYVYSATSLATNAAANTTYFQAAMVRSA